MSDGPEALSLQPEGRTASALSAIVVDTMLMTRIRWSRHSPIVRQGETFEAADVYLKKWIFQRFISRQILEKISRQIFSGFEHEKFPREFSYILCCKKVQLSYFFQIFKMFFFFVRPQVPENHVFPALHRLKKCMCGKKIVPEFGIIIMIYHYNLSIYNFYTGHRIFKVKNFTRGRGFSIWVSFEAKYSLLKVSCRCGCGVK